MLDIKPYLPYSDSVKGAAVPNWLEVCTILHLSLCISPNLKIHLSHQFEISVFIFLDESSFCRVVNAGQHLMLDDVCIYMLISYLHTSALALSN